MAATVAYEPLRNFNLVGDLKTKYLDVKATTVSVVIEVDKALDDLIKEGKESLKIAHLGDVARAEVDKSAKQFVDTINDIEAKIERDPLDADQTAKKIKEANEVLKHYAKIVEANANAAVQKEWQGYLARRKHLKDFRIKCVLKIVLGAIGVAVAVSSAVLTFGALWMNIVAAVKGITDLVQTAKTWAKDIDGVYDDLVKNIGKVDDLNREREIAFKKNDGQKLSKTKEGLKELTNALLPVTSRWSRATAKSRISASSFWDSCLSSKTRRTTSPAR